MLGIFSHTRGTALFSNSSFTVGPEVLSNQTNMYAPHNGTQTFHAKSAVLVISLAKTQCTLTQARCMIDIL